MGKNKKRDSEGNDAVATSSNPRSGKRKLTVTIAVLAVSISATFVWYKKSDKPVNEPRLQHEITVTRDSLDSLNVNNDTLLHLDNIK